MQYVIFIEGFLLYIISSFSVLLSLLFSVSKHLTSPLFFSLPPVKNKIKSYLNNDTNNLTFIFKI